MTFVNDTTKALDRTGGRPMGQPRVGVVSGLGSRAGGLATAIVEGQECIVAGNPVAVGDSVTWFPGRPSVCFLAVAADPNHEIRGYGAGVTGGAAGQSYVITSTADSGPGTLRSALEVGGRNITLDPDIPETTLTLLSDIDATGRDWTLDTDGRLILTGARIRCQGADNWIMRNTRFLTATGDSLAVQNVSGGDHMHFVILQCDFIGPNGDGALDITQNYGANMYGSVIACDFQKHDKTMLVDGNGSNEGGTYFITVWRNNFEDNLSRQPLGQNCRLHVLQNAYDRYGTHDGNQAAATSRGPGQLRVEANTVRPRSVGDIVGYNGLTTTNPRERWSERQFGNNSAVHANFNNLLLWSPDGLTFPEETNQLAGDIFVPPYAYSPDPLPLETIKAAAGAKTLLVA